MPPLQKKTTVAQNMKILFFSWKYIVWPIKWLEISPGSWILNQILNIDSSFRFICKYMRKLLFIIDFCKNFQGKFFFQSWHQFSTVNCTHSYRSLLSGIFLNSYPVKARCAQHLKCAFSHDSTRSLQTDGLSVKSRESASWSKNASFCELKQKLNNWNKNWPPASLIRARRVCLQALNSVIHLIVGHHLI